MQKIVTNLWFDTEAEEAAEFYTSIFKDSRITNVTRYGEAGPREAGTVMTVTWELQGQQFTAINGGPDFKFTEAISLLVNCESQAEIDELWDKLGDGGEPGPCGWLKDRYGLSWQIVPAGMEESYREDPQKFDRMMKALLQMGKIDMEELRQAAEAQPVA